MSFPLSRSIQSRPDRAKNIAQFPRIWEDVSIVDKADERNVEVIGFPSQDKVIDGTKAQLCIKITADDYCIPICHEGMNRSQVLYLNLVALKKILGVDPHGVGGVCLPHGAESGFDPYQAYKDLEDDSEDDSRVLGYLHGKCLPRGPDGDWLHDCFYEAFGCEKALRIGHDWIANEDDLNSQDPVTHEFNLPVLTKARTELRGMFDLLFYNANELRSKCGPDGRVYVFAFWRAAPIFLKRLLECNPGDVDLSFITLVALPFPDVISRAGGPDEIAEYRTAHPEMDPALVTRRYLNVMRHKEVYDFYSCLIAADDGSASASEGPTSASEDPTKE